MSTEDQNKAVVTLNFGVDVDAFIEDMVSGKNHTEFMPNRAVELFNEKAPKDRKIDASFFGINEDKHAKLKSELKKKLKELINPKDIVAAKSTGDVINIPSQDTAAQTAAKNAKINFRTYKA